jgi:hypothetical protein
MPEARERPIVIYAAILANAGIAVSKFAAAIDRLETQIRNKHTDVIRIFIEAKALRSAASIAETDLESDHGNCIRHREVE